MVEVQDLERVKRLLRESGVDEEKIRGRSLEELWATVVPDVVDDDAQTAALDHLMRGEEGATRSDARIVKKRRRLCPDCRGRKRDTNDASMSCPACGGYGVLQWLLTGSGDCTVCGHEAQSLWYVLDPSKDGRCSACLHREALRESGGITLTHRESRKRRTLIYRDALFHGVDIETLSARYGMSAKSVARMPEYVAARQTREWVRNVVIASSSPNDSLVAGWPLSERRKRTLRRSLPPPAGVGPRVLYQHLSESSPERASNMLRAILKSAAEASGWCCEDCRRREAELLEGISPSPM